MRRRVKDASDEARAKCNPFASINKSIFMNRAATKIAAMDATFRLTSTKDNKPFIFADICGGPGGFTEYLLWRVHGWGGTAQGYGITLKSTDDAVNWRIDEFHPPNFVAIDGPDGTGDIYKEANIRAFGETVQQRTQGCGVDLAVADGGFDFTGHEQHQEHETRRLRLCEVITMLTCLKQGGTFVCKFFDITEDFTANVVWLLYQLFDQICITKPFSSRPANSERYLVCKGLRTQFPENLIKSLLAVSGALQSNPAQVGSFIPRAVLEDDEAFVKYVQKKNLRFSSKQLDALKDLSRCIDHPDRPPLYDQERYRTQCLNAWHLPLDRPSSKIP
ncbi:FtsJ-like methyltransferase-domain-containing protein [Fennellomyces sp. T-0311]|nr:FtsJ-like methyltransferase-domain-containing protein [Fennellomyces sp. T-0311]